MLISLKSHSQSMYINCYSLLISLKSESQLTHTVANHILNLIFSPGWAYDATVSSRTCLSAI